MDGSVEGSEPRPTGRPNARLRQSVGDLVRSMAVVLAAVAALLLVTWRPQPDPVRTVDPAPVAALASRQAGFEILIPVLEGLRVTSARWEPTAATGDVPAWHIGAVTESGGYVQVAQTRAEAEAFVAEQSGDGRPAGEVPIGVSRWSRMESEAGRSLVLTDGGVTTVVTGTVAWPELERVAGQL